MKNKIKEIESKFKAFIDKDNRLKILFIIGIIGILLIFLSSFFEDEKTKETSVSQSSIDTNTDEFIENTEKELVNLLKDISGVGEVKVMVSVSGTTELEYAQELTKDNDEQSNSYKNQYVFIENNGEKEALVKKINKPQISGVCVVCRGGEDVKVIEKVTRAVATVLDISSTSICVMQLK
ncbi:MAG: stage III sporulation protein AG [Oscillospiraceae bacterium]|nr:stage III sporulation protein AG [Oscillospiraceae bacterium]